MIRFNNIPIKFTICISIIILGSCIESSDFDAWDTSESQVVIEARITDVDTVLTVIVSRSVSPNDTVLFDPVNNASVIIKDDKGNTASLIPEGNGRYTSDSIQGVPGNRYLLIVEVDSIIYRAIETMPPKPKIDSVEVQYQDYVTILDSIGYYLTFYSAKNDDTVQYYRLEVELNGDPYDNYSDMLLFEDLHIANNYKMRLPYYFSEGDTVSVKIYSLTSPIYEYFTGLAKQFTYNFSNIQPPLMDPATNFKSEPLGYFQASSVAVSTIIIEKEQNK